MLIKQITILVSLALLAVPTLAEAWDYDAALAELRATWEGKEVSYDYYGRPIDPATACDGKPCDYPELVQHDLTHDELDGINLDDLPEATWDEDREAERGRAMYDASEDEEGVWCIVPAAQIDIRKRYLRNILIRLDQVLNPMHLEQEEPNAVAASTGRVGGGAQCRRTMVRHREMMSRFTTLFKDLTLKY
ncbi:hypothetical protein BGZ95_008201 [Linnemannia exigua]|uniref:Uncharacterized protein n=1 Tax=Linnemannia exigua TaxID=604196 RepID=A0AAD4DGJ2_9FUNG|nr:hypothetical protein BGZ95_008201 [Linnemannia exigua]